MVGGGEFPGKIYVNLKPFFLRSLNSKTISHVVARSNIYRLTSMFVCLYNLKVAYGIVS